MPDDLAATGFRAEPLFAPLTPGLVRALESYRQTLDAAHPLKGKHKALLHHDVKTLSLSLTAERGPGPRPNYLSAPASLSAYLHYFLPWNLYRLSRLFAGLDLDIPDGAAVLDIGAGPLTAVQALWLSRPKLRERRLRFVCVDQTGQALRAGRALFAALAGEAGRAWTIESVQAPAHKAPAGPFRLVLAANALNELSRGRGEEGHEALERMAELIASRVGPGGQALLVEPGTRLGGKLLARLREVFLEEGFSPLAPCTHGEACPMLAPRWRSWCHFVFPAKDAPGWLMRLTKLAGLDKERVSLSFLRMAADKPEYRADAARVVSHRFPLPPGQGCYLCSAHGLRLLTFGQAPFGLVSGALVSARFPEPGERDKKTGAWLTPLAEKN
jgi:ribosomal protein RSM22 (predicted rRNA methylase)